MKRFICVLLVLLCWSCQESTTTSSDLIDFIPRKASVIIKTNDVEELLLEIQNNELLSEFKDSHYGLELLRYGTFLRHFKPDQESLITFTKIGKDDFDITYITENTASLFSTDSTTHTQKTVTATAPKIIEVTAQETTFYVVEISGTFMASSSQLLLENTIREQNDTYTNDRSFIKAYNTSSNKAIASILLKGEEAGDLWRAIVPKTRNNSFKDAFSWLQADLDVSQNDLKANGVVLVNDSANLHLQLLKNTRPQPNKVAQVAPLSASAVTSLTFDDWEVYKANLAQYHGIDPSKYTITQEELLSTFFEVSLITNSEGDVISATSQDIERTNLALSSQQDVHSTFRQVPIYKLDGVDFKNAFAKAYSQTLQLPKVNFYCVIEDFYLFSATTNALENSIANYQNKATLATSKAYQNTATQLSRSASLLYIYNTSKIPYAELVGEKNAKKLKAVSTENYPFAAVQFIQDNGFMHLQSVINKNESPLQEGAVTQIASTKLDEHITKAPHLVKNHRTKGMDIVLQDQANNLYLLSNSGKILWTKALDSPIVGDVQQVDLYRNGRLQLAFVTENTFYILDRNGKDVAPFPLKFKDEITQPLAIFDYEKNRNYRFVITQTDGIMMYDKTAKPVKGFTFSKAANEIILPPQHLRIENKDYITIAENNGKLNILSRTGKSRIEVADRINFGDKPLYKDGTSFALYDVNGEKIIISQKGKVKKISTDYGATAISHKEGNSAAIRDNNLFINGKKTTLEYGSYTAPVILKTNKSFYITFTNRDTKQVYVYDKNSKALENFPVYGTTTSHIGLLERNKSLGLVTQGDEKTVLVYRIN